jgi:pimeloyl-ACP methyl ester carboxylesterase
MKRPRLKRFLLSTLLGVLVLLGVGYGLGYRSDIPYQTVVDRYKTAQSHFVQINGRAVHYTDQGQGPTILLLHGSGADVTAWAPLAKEMAQNYRVVAFDFPGSGLSENPADEAYSLPAAVATTDAFVKALGLSPLVVIGHSVGGQVAWTAALDHPPWMRNLVLMAPTGHPYPSPLTWTLAGIPGVGEIMRKVTPRAIIEMNLQDVFYDKSKITADLTDRYYTMIRREGARDAMLQKMRQVSFARHEQIACLDVPTLIVWGAEDEWLPAALGEWFHHRIVGSRLVTLPLTGHDIPEEAPPSELAALVSGWLAQAPTTVSPPSPSGDCPLHVKEANAR